KRSQSQQVARVARPAGREQAQAAVEGCNHRRLPAEVNQCPAHCSHRWIHSSPRPFACVSCWVSALEFVPLKTAPVAFFFSSARISSSSVSLDGSIASACRASCAAYPENRRTLRSFRILLCIASWLIAERDSERPQRA